MKHTKTAKIILGALFLALAYIMPFLTGQIPGLGARLCPMHIPVMLCGFACGWPMGLAVGFVAPLLRSATLGMPPLFPTAICMAFELAAYGAVSGFAYRHLPNKKPFILFSLLIAMAAGRIIWGIAMFICLGINGGSFGLRAFWAGALTNAVPGIIVQIICVPVIVIVLEKTGLSQKTGSGAKTI